MVLIVLFHGTVSTESFKVQRMDKFIVVPMTFRPAEFNEFEITIVGPKNIRLALMPDLWKSKQLPVRLDDFSSFSSTLTFDVV